MNENIRKGTDSALDNLIASSLMTVSLCSSYLATSSSLVTPVYINLCKASVGLLVCSWIAYYRDFYRRHGQVGGLKDRDLWVAFPAY